METRTKHHRRSSFFLDVTQPNDTKQRGSW